MGGEPDDDIDAFSATGVTMLPLIVDSARTGADAVDRGSRAGSYTIVETIGRGGWGTVYLATDDSGRRAAVKVLHSFLASEPQGVERFLREVDTVSRVKHPGIVEVYEVGRLADDRPFFVMELLEGKNLRRLIQEEGRLSAVETFEILDEILSAVAAAHAAGVVHRDLKAENVIVDAARRVKLLDFGIAKLLQPDPSVPGITATQQVIGTAVAMAPEQIRCQAVDERTDIYGLGVLLFHMLTGIYPFQGNYEEVSRMHLETPPRPPSSLATVSPALDAVVLRCLEKDPAARFANVAALQRALRAAILREQAPAIVRSGVALLVRAAAVDDQDDGALADAAQALDAAEAVLREAGYHIALQTATEVMGVRAGDGPRDEVLDDAPELAGRLHARLADEAGAGVRLTITVHNDELHLRAGTEEPIGGALLEIGRWSFKHDGVAITPEPERPR